MTASNSAQQFDAVVVGGGPAGATAATDLADKGLSVMLLDKAGRIKPCGGAIPPAAMEEFGIPDALLKAHATSARMIAPSGTTVDMPIDGGYVGMVDREEFDEWLRERAATHGATRVTGSFKRITRDTDDTALVHYEDVQGEAHVVRARAIIGADGARSAVGRQTIPGADRIPYVAAYHEIIKAPDHDLGGDAFDGNRCDVYYQGELSPDFYAWIFPHGDTVSVGVGSARKGFSLRGAVDELREKTGLTATDTVRREGAPIPLKPLKRWDNGRDVVLAGDAAGIVAPASGEGIYYALTGGRLAADAVAELCVTGDVKALKTARNRFMKAHGRVFWVLGIMQKFWYSSDRRRERFVSMCRDPDVQYLTWQAYMHKKLVKAKPAAHVRIFFKDLAHLVGIAPT
ncbi:MAG: geranylgeranyl diphosphate reductase [Gammaproteobacteria bacterium]|nr:geranylgeranyl diphosphate reductase [Gammaproteobacteria bacterium]